MSLRRFVGVAVTFGLASAVPLRAWAECFGEYPYQVCTDTYVSPSGDMSVRSYDTMGNTYSLDTTTRRMPGGEQITESRDSMGNRYSLRTWTDSEGTHSVDSMGNRCTITRSGGLVGCGQ